MTDTTYRLERLRAMALGIIETGGQTFLLLIAVRVFDASAAPKAWNVSGMAAGLLMSPVAVALVSHRGWTSSQGASRVMWVGAGCFLLAAAWPVLPVYVACSMVGMCGDHVGGDAVRSLLRSDIFDRAVPWAQLIFSTSHLPSDLNLDARSRWSVLAVWSCLILMVLGFQFHWVWIGSILSAAALIFLNLDLYQFFQRRGGVGFSLGAIGLHSLYYIYSSTAFVIVLAWHFLRRFFGKTQPKYGSV